MLETQTIRGANFSPDSDEKLNKSAKKELDRIISKLSAKKKAWANLPISEKIAILDEIHRDLPLIEEQWVDRLQSTLFLMSFKASLHVQRTLLGKLPKVAVDT
jgi:hypothetical protein